MGEITDCKPLVTKEEIETEVRKTIISNTKTCLYCAKEKIFSGNFCIECLQENSTEEMERQITKMDNELIGLHYEHFGNKQLYYYCHPESEALWYSIDPNEDGTGDGLVCGITKERYKELLTTGWGKSNQLKPLTGSTITPF